MNKLCVNYCLALAWAGVICLGYFTTLAFREPYLLDIEEKDQKKAKHGLMFSTLVYVLLAAYLCCMVGGDEEGQEGDREGIEIPETRRKGPGNVDIDDSDNELIKED